tara:strand:- start:191 stop:913 length:723 start_codon:yes stop_codon:yes gene_type:complete
MTKLTCGERLDDNGIPVNGTGFEYESDGFVAELLAQRSGPVVSSPQQGEWVWELVGSAESNGEFERYAVVCPTGNQGPITHFHPTFDELFKVVSGTFALKADGEDITLEAGEELMVKKGTVHTFRCVGDDGEHGVLIAETYPAVGFTDLLYTAFGLGHEGKTKSSGDPKLLQMMVMLRGFRTNLGIIGSDLMTPVPPGQTVVAIISRILAPLGRLLGYKANFPQYLEKEFWEKHVNQPSK